MAGEGRHQASLISLLASPQPAPKSLHLFLNNSDIRPSLSSEEFTDLVTFLFL